MLIKMVVCHGEVVVLRDVEMDDGSRLNLTVAQYIDIDLGSDELMFRNPLYNQILAEAVAHCGDEEFKAETYFINHPDIAVGQLASQLTMDEVPLPHSLEMRTNEKTLQQQVEHLLLDFRMSVVKQHIKDLQAQLRQAGSNMQTVMQLMQELKAAQDVRNGLAQRLGNDVVV